MVNSTKHPYTLSARSWEPSLYSRVLLSSTVNDIGGLMLLKRVRKSSSLDKSLKQQNTSSTNLNQNIGLITTGMMSFISGFQSIP